MILDKINSPADMKSLSDGELKVLADEVRIKTIEAASKTGGHLGASLGVVELSVALHAVFDTPNDKLIWDVGHQSYPHKILTGRKDKMETLRQGGGLSGFTKRSESKYDPFGAGHSSTSISAALGMAVARDLKGDDNRVIAVIGDGAMSAGQAYEALNNAGAIKSRLIVILNDNDMSIAKPTGAMSKHLTKIVSSKRYRGIRSSAKKVLARMPKACSKVMGKMEGSLRGALGRGTIFEELGFYYIGVVDGHDLPSLLSIFHKLKNAPQENPVLVHVRTTKGKGYAPAEAAHDAMHGVGRFEVKSGKQDKGAKKPTYTKVFADSLIQCAKCDEKIVGITAAMPSGTGMDEFGAAFPKRMFDVGIAEQHAVTFAGGLAAEGFKPFVAIYSTFLQRAYDQVIHDVAIQNLPVRFIIDRAGLVGADGATHAGSFDTAFLAPIPNFVIMAPSDKLELQEMVKFAANYDKSPIAVRFPRGAALEGSLKSSPVELGKGRIIKTGKSGKAIISFGARLAEAQIAADKLNATLVDARFAKPLDEALVRDILQNHKKVVTIEEGSHGGFGSIVLEFAAHDGLLQNTQITPMTLPDVFQDHGACDAQYRAAGLDAKGIIKAL